MRFPETGADTGLANIREVGAHKRVADVIIRGKMDCVECQDCGATWPEGGRYPRECKT